MDALHYKVWEAWGHKIRGETITEDNITDPVLRHQEFFFEIDSAGMVIERAPTNNDDCYYIKAIKDGKNYIIPKKFIGEMPFKPTKWQDVRLKKSDTVVWRFVKAVESFTIPRKPLRNIKKFIIEEFNPVTHMNPRQFTILKLIALAPEIKVAICGEVATGKNCNLTILRHLLGNYAPKVIKPTLAKLWVTLKNNTYVNMDEITSWPAENVKNIEDLAAASADESPDMDKYALDRNKSMEVMSLSKKSITFTFNRPDELDCKKGIPFEKKFENPTKITDRFPRLLFTGKITSVIQKPNQAEAIEIMTKNFDVMCQIAAKCEYIRNNYSLHLHHWKRDKSIFRRRHEANLKTLLDLIDVISDTQQEFDDWIRDLNKCHTDYMDMINQPLSDVVFKGESALKVDSPVEDMPDMDLSGSKK
jgi:hypothetical protein